MGLAVSVPLLILAVIFLVAGWFNAKTPGEVANSQSLAFFSVLIAALWFAGCRAVAWIINGFRDPA